MLTLKEPIKASAVTDFSVKISIRSYVKTAPERTPVTRSGKQIEGRVGEKALWLRALSALEKTPMVSITAVAHKHP